MTSISLVILTQNEEANIERCIRSVPSAQDIVVLDSGSTDRTVEIAKSLGARVFTEPWRGFSGARKRLEELAKFDWILALDADEALSPAALEELHKFLSDSMSISKNAKVGAYKFPRKSFYMGRWISYGGWYPDYQTRLYHRGRAQWSSDSLHEHLEAQAIEKFTAPILHWVFRDLQHQIETNNRYSTLGAVSLHQSGRRFSLMMLVFKPISKFLETYIWKRGFLDGLPGFIISVGAAYSMFLRWAKLWELENSKVQDQ